MAHTRGPRVWGLGWDVSVLLRTGARRRIRGPWKPRAVTLCECQFQTPTQPELHAAVQGAGAHVCGFVWPPHYGMIIT